ncbi:MAG TPA: cytidine deaminase [Candidatus Cloacimonadota bacterium]|nr:cytidine deaminase [Candidatus Cloacimonadota bacterium]
MNEQEMKKIAEAAAKNAYAPYSGYSVGAALETKSGKVYSGCNVENASYGLTNCAERTAVFKAVSEGEQEFEKILIFADSDFLPTPCGACRQVLAEFGKDLKVVMISRKERKESTIAELLPLDFQFQKK